MKRNDWIFYSAVVVAFAAVAGCFLVWIHSFGSSDKPASQSGPTGSAGSAGAADTASNRLVIPSIGTNAPVIPEGASGPNGGALDVPSSVQVVGWWDGVWKSPGGVVQEKVAKPGQSGVALLAGHID